MLWCCVFAMDRDARALDLTQRIEWCQTRKDEQFATLTAKRLIAQQYHDRANERLREARQRRMLVIVALVARTHVIAQHIGRRKKIIAARRFRNESPPAACRCLSWLLRQVR